MVPAQSSSNHPFVHLITASAFIICHAFLPAVIILFSCLRLRRLLFLSPCGHYPVFPSSPSSSDVPFSLRSSSCFPAFAFIVCWPCLPVVIILCSCLRLRHLMCLSPCGHHPVFLPSPSSSAVPVSLRSLSCVPVFAFVICCSCLPAVIILCRVHHPLCLSPCGHDPVFLTSPSSSAVPFSLRS
ncbi:hypothetical protein V1264_001301 [Littorina saxatilis]|uniref:Uncharacterized protein n=1 Tax=Littorina saxatilis TaxID=31220 RepID=A0AAN9GPK1_9CAEN